MAYTKEQIKAAYAVNLCTVSVSQIIEYEDLQIMEQEYEAILNNLNLEQIPKDEALLKILKQILDTITYFRIEDGDKQFLDKEYQQKIEKLPTVKSLQSDYAELLERKKKIYPEYRKKQSEMKELLTIKANVDRLLNMDIQPSREEQHEKHI